MERADVFTITDWEALVRGEYDEMPGLSLTAMQVQRLWQLEPTLAASVLRQLVSAGFLTRTPLGKYVRTDDAPSLKQTEKPWRLSDGNHFGSSRTSRPG